MKETYTITFNKKEWISILVSLNSRIESLEKFKDDSACRKNLDRLNRIFDVIENELTKEDE